MIQVLIIEDDPYVRRFYERLFKLHKYDIDIAKDGEEGLRKAKLIKPPVILVDYMMSDINGLEVLRLLKSDPDTKDCKIIMLTNMSDPSIAAQAAALGADGFITKSSITDEELLSTVDGHLPKAQPPK